MSKRQAQNVPLPEFTWSQKPVFLKYLEELSLGNAVLKPIHSLKICLQTIAFHPIQQRTSTFFKDRRKALVIQISTQPCHWELKMN